jgi:hypothetical protein
MNIPGIIFPRALKQFFWLKILKFFNADPGSLDLGSREEKLRSGIRNKHPGYATLVSDSSL